MRSAVSSERHSRAQALPYFNPHSVRNTLAQLGERVCPNPEAFKAWSQNLGHEQVLTTFTSYGSVSHHRQAEIIAGLREPARAGGTKGPAGASAPDAETIAWVMRHVTDVATGTQTTR